MKKWIGVILTIVVVAAIYFIFFYKKSATQLASSLGLYTGDQVQDATLNNMITTALTSGGTIAGSGNLDWELTQTAQKMAVPGSLPIDIWGINGKITPAGAFLGTVDTTHDYYSGSPDLTHAVPVLDENGFPTGETTQVQNTNTGGGNSYIPQAALNQLWAEFNSLKQTLENPLYTGRPITPSTT